MIITLLVKNAKRVPKNQSMYERQPLSRVIEFSKADVIPLKFKVYKLLYAPLTQFKKNHSQDQSKKCSY